MSNRIYRISSVTILYTFLVFHHPSVRNYTGDFIIGMFFIRDLFNPLQHSAQIMKLVCIYSFTSPPLFLLSPLPSLSYCPLSPIQLKLQDTRLYFLSGVAVVVVQFVFRILDWPACILLYAAQYHNWDVIKAIYGLHAICIVSIVFWQVMETYWFVKVLTIVRSFTREKVTNNLFCT